MIDKPRHRLPATIDGSYSVESTQSLPAEPSKVKAKAFSFGDPEPVLSGGITDYLGIFADSNALYYIPPVSLSGLSKLLSANGTHASALGFKCNQLLANWKENPMISRKEIRAAFQDYLVFENGYLLAIRNGLGGVNRYVRLPAINMRVGTDNNYWLLNNDGSMQEFAARDIIHLQGNDVRQSIYGVPDYFAGVQSILLGEAATLFRRRYYQNGAHAGYIFVTFDLDDDMADDIEDAIANTKGPGNYRSMYLNMSSTVGGKTGITKDRVQLIPVGDYGNNDEYDKIKEVTQQDILNLHRVPAALASIMPMNVAGHGDLKNIREVYYDSEILPMQAIWEELNDVLPQRGRIEFKEPRWLVDSKKAV